MLAGAKTGKDNGFSILFDIESYDYGYYDEGSEGLKVAVVHHLDMPIIRQRAFHVAPGTENQIPVTPTLYTTTQQVQLTYSIASINDVLFGFRFLLPTFFRFLTGSLLSSATVTASTRST